MSSAINTTISLDALLTLIFVCVLCCAAAWQYFFSARRTQSAVADELLAEEQASKNPAGEGEEESSLHVGKNQFDFSGEAGTLGLYRPALRIAFLRRIGMYPWFGALIACMLRFLVIPITAPVSATVAVAIVGLAIGYLVREAAKRNQASSWERRCLFCLPLTMERLVMGVQAGLDLLAALSVILKDEEETPTNDPILELLGIVMKLTESGLPFEHALREVGQRVRITSIRHVFTHLAIAHREGGELVMPLKELSDATQTMYQETIEEEIAKLPVKATLPLLCTFAGLIICFITSPLIQVIMMTAEASSNLK